MERRLTEEQLTKVILNWLEKNSWEIICFDFPQSGTGVILHSSCRIGDTKNKNSIIPDIVAIKNKKVVFFENKDRFVLSDFEKIKKLKISNDHLDSISKLLKKHKYNYIFYGVGLPNTKLVNEKLVKYQDDVDFVIQTNGIDTKLTYQTTNIF